MGGARARQVRIAAARAPEAQKCRGYKSTAEASNARRCACPGRGTPPHASDSSRTLDGRSACASTPRLRRRARRAGEQRCLAYLSVSCLVARKADKFVKGHIHRHSIGPFPQRAGSRTRDPCLRVAYQARQQAAGLRGGRRRRAAMHASGASRRAPFSFWRVAHGLGGRGQRRGPMQSQRPRIVAGHWLIYRGTLTEDARADRGRRRPETPRGRRSRTRAHTDRSIATRTPRPRAGLARGARRARTLM